MPNINWNANLYDTKHSFVAQYGEDLFHLLQATPEDRILDLGCGTGTLTQKIAVTGADVIGIDASSEMIEKAKANFPNIAFEVKDATNFQFENKFDAIFSNATLHWITKKEVTIEQIYKNLKKRGRLVLEMGGKGNVKSISEAIKQAMAECHFSNKVQNDFWYFPSLSEYTTLLENQGFRVELAQHFERPTPLTGLDGMKNWIEMFGKFFFKEISNEQATIVINKAVEILKPDHFVQNTWYADYWRLRIKAIKE